MAFLMLTLILSAAALLCAYFWSQSAGQAKLVAGVAAVGFGSMAALNALSWVLSLSRRLVMLAVVVLVLWAIFTIVTRR